MDAFVVALVLTAAVLHVVWNVLLKTSGDPLRTAAVGLLAAAAVVVPLACRRAGRRPASRRSRPRPWRSPACPASSRRSTSSCSAAAYRRGDLSVVYPTARGTAPLLAVIVGVVVLGERLTPIGFAGVFALLAGILMLQRPWIGLRRDADPRVRAATIFALGTGVTIATYSAIDRVGVRMTEPLFYAAGIWVVQTVGTVAWVLFIERNPGGIAYGIDVRKAALGGILTLIAYGLVLFALAVAPLTAVAPLRESAIVLASGWGALRLREAVDRRDATRRIAASILVLAGILLLVAD